MSRGSPFSHHTVTTQALASPGPNKNKRKRIEETRIGGDKRNTIQDVHCSDHILGGTHCSPADIRGLMHFKSAGSLNGNKGGARIARRLSADQIL